MKLILDTNFKVVTVIDIYESFIWTDRFSDYGDFEIYTAVSKEAIEYFKEDYYIWSPDSEHTMIIEDVQIRSDIEMGNRLLITGRSLESILYRRIVWKQTVLNGNLQNEIQRLLNENIILPTDDDRKINNFIFKPSINSNITDLTVDAQIMGESLYDVIKKLCDSNKIGFRIILSELNKFVFELYVGVDRSYEQTNIPYVIFSPKFDNLINSNYLESKKSYKTVTLVAGEGEGSDRKTETVAVRSGPGLGLDRREIFTDARSVSSTVDGQTLSDVEYKKQLAQRGLEHLSENSIIKTFEGQVETAIMYKYGEDFYMGDIVQMENEYGIESRSKITEIVFSETLSETTVYPTFTTIE